MNALILGAGFGTRLGTLSVDTPKILQVIGTETILEINVRKLFTLGINKIFLNVHHLSHLVESEVKKLSSEFHIELIYEKELQGTLGTLGNLLDRESTQNLLVMHGDNYFEDNLFGLKERFYAHTQRFLGVIATFQTKNPSSAGILGFAEDGSWVTFHEKSDEDLGNIANAAIYIFNQFAIQEILKMNCKGLDISKDLLPKLIGKLSTYPLQGVFLDIGTPKDLERARMHRTSFRQ